MPKRWVPLESNPEVLTRFASKLGLDTKRLAFCDIYGFDEGLLALVPQPVQALLLLFPVSEKLDAEDAEADEARRSKGASIDPGLFYMKQTIGNACGTIGVLHAVGNNRQAASLRNGSFLEQFFGATASMTPAERGAYLEDPPQGAPDIEAFHAEAAQDGVTAPQLDDDVTPHYVALVNHSGRLMELDGRKAFPVDHGSTTQETLLQDAIVVAKKFMQRVDSIHFNMIALTTPADF